MVKRALVSAYRVLSSDLMVLVAVLVIVGGTWGFVELTDEVRENSTQEFDEQVLVKMRRADDPQEPIGPRWLHGIARDITALGGYTVLTLMIGGVAGFLLIRKQRAAVILVLVATVGGLLLNGLLKELIARDRPSVVPHLHDVNSPSFPSGHSMLAAVVYLTLGSLLARFVTQWRLRIYILAVAMLLTLLVGLSRVYLGVHYPTDVLAGWTAGLVWAVLCWLTARSLQRRGTVEKAEQAADDPDPNPDTESPAAAASRAR